ncbi:MAG: PKD-like domain-containing protein [Bacteroidota bacterium]
MNTESRNMFFLKWNDMTSYKRIVSLLILLAFSFTNLQAQITSTCSAVAFSYSGETGYQVGETYSWTIGTVGPGITGQTVGLGGASTITQTLTNSTNTASTISYNVTTTKPSAFTLTVTVYPSPNLTNASTFISPICSGISQNYSALSDISGTSIIWTRSFVAGISNPASAGTTSVTEALINTTTAPITVPYLFTLTTANGCISKPTINAVVNPIPILSSSLTPPAICGGAAFSYTPTSATALSTFAWTRSVQPNISNGLGSGTGNPGETLVNTSTSIVPVAYVFTTTANGCSNPQTVTVSVKPLPTVSSPQTATACNNSSFIINPVGVPAGTQYTWTSPSASPAGSISNGSSQTLQNSISQTLINSTASPAQATYTITPWAAGCSGASFQGIVTVSAIGTGTVINNITSTACNNSSFNVSPTSAPSGTQYIWSAPTYTPALSLSGGVAQGTAQNSIFGTLINSTTAPGTATYNVTPISGACTGTVFTVAVTVNNPAILSSSLAPPAICSNALFSYSPTSITANTVFSWSRASIAGISNTPATGIDNPNEILINTTALPVKVDYVYTLTTGTCVNQQTVSVFVNPAPTLSSAIPNPICSGTIFNYIPLSATTGTTFTWTRPVIPFISNPATSATGNPNESLINTSINPVIVTYNYTLTANGCSNPQVVNVLVNPIPIISNQITNSCSGTAFSFTPTNVPTGTQYTWLTPTLNPVLSISGGLPQGTLQNSITGTLNNLTLNPATATYIITPNANGCIGSTFSLTVSVTATTSLTSSLTPPAICSNTAFNYAPTSNTFGTVFGWTRPNIIGIATAASSGVGNPNEILVNNSTVVVAVPYLFTLTTATGCVSTQTVTVNVNPAPVLSSNLVATAICTGSLFNYTPTSLSPGATFNWNRPIIPGISNAAGSGTGLNYPNEILVNTTALPITVSYNFTITVNTCSNTQTVTVVVNPKPVVPAQNITICGNSSFSVIPTGVIAGTQYTWTIPTATPTIGSITGGAAQPILQDSISQFLGNATINNANAIYTVTPTANGCTGPTFILTVTVKPTPGFSNLMLPSVCSGVAFNYAATPAPAGTTYTWSNPIIGPANSLTGGSAQAINQNSVSQTLVSSNNLIDTATYTVTPASSGCTGATFTLTVPIKPVPVVNNIFDTVCSGAAFTVIPSPVPANTTYTWILPTSIPFGKVIGGTANNIPVNVISQIPTNTGTIPAQLFYTITPVTNGCVGASFNLLETVGVPLNPIPNAITTICSGTGFDVTPVTVPANTKYTWTIQSITPAGMISGTSTTTIRQTKVTNDTLINLSAVTATAVYAVTPSNTGCTGSIFLATINVRAVPKATITGNPIICAYPFDTLTVSFAGTAPWSFNYLDNGVAKTQTGIITNPFTWIVPTPLLSTSKTLAITRVTDMACIDSVDTANYIQKVNPLPIGMVNSLHGIYICNNTIDTLWVSYTAADSLVFQWTLNGIQIPGITTDSIGTLTPGRYNALFTNQYGCTDSSAAPINLIYVPQPVINFSYDSYCINKQINFKNITDTSFTGPTTWLWDMGDSTTRTSFNASVVYPHSGDRHIRLTASQLYCPLYQTSFDSTINIEFPIPGLRMPSVSAYSGQYTPIAARSLPGYRYRWTPSRGIDYPDSASVNFNYQLTQEYLINLISKGGCITNDSVLVRVYDDKLVDIFVPKSFTPNGDGINDKLYTYLTGVKTFQYFKVYNRFGKLMFETRNYDEGWDGTVGGTPQPMAIYIWVAVGVGLDGAPVERKGETLLLR